MLLKNYKKIQRLAYKEFLPKQFFFYEFEKYNVFNIKQIILWLLCNKKTANCYICKTCLSCIKFLHNTHNDYYELTESENIDYVIKYIEDITIDLPLISQFKIILLILNNEDILLIQNIMKITEKKNKVLLFFFIKSNLSNKKLLNNKCVFDNTICILTIKLLYKFYKNNYDIIHLNNILDNKNLNKIKILNSFIIFLNNIMIKKINIKNIIRLIIAYKTELIYNYNLNIIFFINFLVKYIKN